MQLDILDAVVVQFCQGVASQRVVNLDAGHTRTQASHQRGDETASGSDFQAGLVALDLQRLEHARLHSGAHHRLTVIQRYAGIGESQVAVRGRHEVLPRHLRHQIEDSLVQNLPGPDLLLYHVETSLLEVHESDSMRTAVCP